LRSEVSSQWTNGRKSVRLSIFGSLYELNGNSKTIRLIVYFSAPQSHSDELILTYLYRESPHLSRNMSTLFNKHQIFLCKSNTGGVYRLSIKFKKLSALTVSSHFFPLKYHIKIVEKSFYLNRRGVCRKT
jgi:hypothetical protein